MVSIDAPAKSGFDEAISVIVTNLAPRQIVTLTMQTTRSDVSLTSFANFEADEQGRVDLAKQPALVGSTYQGCDAMGLFWSMEVTTKPLTPMRMLTGFDLDVFTYRIQVHDGHRSSMSEALVDFNNKTNCLAESSIKRLFVPDGVTRVKVAHGKMRGALFLPPGEGPFPAVIHIVGGTSRLVAYKGGLFAGRGFACLCVAYMGYEDLPAELQAVDSDYFNECYDFLSKHPQIVKNGIGIYGECHGGSIALALARCQPGIRAIVAVCPHAFATGYDFNLKLGNKDEHGTDVVTTIPGVPWRNELIKTGKDGIGDYRSVSSHSLQGDWRRHSLEYGKVKAPLLIVFGGDEQLFDLDYVLPFIKQQLEEENKTNYEIAILPDAGHTIRSPYFPATDVVFFPLVRCNVHFGGKPAGHAKAQEDLWQMSLDFLSRHLTNNPKL